jgi:hypothetical protein
MDKIDSRPLTVFWFNPEFNYLINAEPGRSSVKATLILIAPPALDVTQLVIGRANQEGASRKVHSYRQRMGACIAMDECSRCRREMRKGEKSGSSL